MRVIDLYKQLQILLESGQEDLPVIIYTDRTYAPLEVVDIDDGKCHLCESWTQVFDTDSTDNESKEIVKMLQEEGIPVRKDGDFMWRDNI